MSVRRVDRTDLTLAVLAAFFVGLGTPAVLDGLTPLVLVPALAGLVLSLWSLTR